VRWDNLKVEDEAQRLLPGYRDPAAVRRFDAPEALDTRFYEVRAKSVLNKVPPASQMPFRWTVNPYRGCSHACAYCAWGGTPVLMADGASRPLGDLCVGDRIRGSRLDGDRRAMVETEVLDKWKTTKAAFEVHLEDGTRLLASGEHRFLTASGWKHVAPHEQDLSARSYLTTDDVLIGHTSETAWLASHPPLRVASVKTAGERMEMYDITTGTEDFIANGVVSHNCFARPTHTYLGFDAGRDFEREIVVKVNAPELLRAELARPSWQGEHVAIGTNTDPYQWVEGRYKLMEGIWQALLDARNPCSILTKSPLLLRDTELLKELARTVGLTACLSIPTLDQKVWRETEPRTPNPRARLEAVAELNRAGVPTGVLIAPLMPGINDAPQQVEPLLEAISEAGATNIAGIALHLRGEVKDVFMGWMRESRPELVSRYEQLYGRRAYAPQPERERLARMVRRGERPGAFWRSRVLEGADMTDTGHPPQRSAAERAAALEGQQALF
jgi:DNA repair photolyase